MTTKTTTAFTAIAATTAILVTTASSVQGQNSNTPVGQINLQNSTPGTVQSGHGNISGTFKAGYLKGNGLGVTGINANNIAVGTVSDDRLSNNVARLQPTTPGNQQAGNMNIAGMLLAGFFKGDGSNITGINAGNLTSGTLNDSRLSTNIPRLFGSNTFSGTQYFNGTAHIYGSSIAMGNTAVNTDTRVLLLRSSDNFGELYLKGQNGKDNVLLSAIGGSPNNGWMGVRDPNGVTQAKLYADTNGNGVVAADVKNFVVPNPRNPQQDIVYACVEGPEAAAYVRGVGHLVNGKAHIVLPEHFTVVTVSSGMTVQITPKSPASKGLAYFGETNFGFDVAELHGGKGNYDFAWEAKAVRRMHEDYAPVRNWDEVMPAGTDRAAAWSGRLKSISERENTYASKRSNRP